MLPRNARRVSVALGLQIRYGPDARKVRAGCSDELAAIFDFRQVGRSRCTPGIRLDARPKASSLLAHGPTRVTQSGQIRG